MIIERQSAVLIQSADAPDRRRWMIRSAGAPFLSPYNVQSDEWDALLTRRLEAMKEFEDERERLLACLFTVIGKEKSQLRLDYIRVKRSVFNRREIDWPIGNGELGPVDESLQRYQSLHRCLTFDPTVVERTISELRDKLRALLSDPLFATAVDYSCAWLRREATKPDLRVTRQFTNAERAVFSYATKMFSKANPFYIFAGLSVRSLEENVPPDSVEVVIDEAIFRTLEESIARRGPTALVSYLSMCPVLETSGKYNCLVMDGTSLRLLALPKSAMLRKLVEYFSTNLGPHTLEGALLYTDNSEQRSLPERVDREREIQRLINLSILKPYYIRDRERPFLDLGHVSGWEEISRVTKLHRSVIPLEMVPDLHCEIKDAVRVFAPALADRPRYYLNAHVKESPLLLNEYPERLAADLVELKPLFQITNFSEEGALIKNWLTHTMEDEPGPRRRYLDLIGPFLDTFGKSAEHPGTIVGAADTPRRGLLSAAHAAFSSYEGILSKDDIRHLGDQLARAGAGTNSKLELCVNGNFGEREGIFYMSNVFLGHGRYLSRFGACRLPNRQSSRAHNEITDVQLTVQLTHNRDSGFPVYASGTGFDSRERHRFEEWVSLADVFVERCDDGRIRYIHGPSGRELRFHFCGYLLTNYLPLLFKLLLINQGDYVYVPCGPVTHSQLTRTAPFQDGLFFRNVCLRRPQWHIPRQTFEGLLSMNCILEATVKLCELLQSTTSRTNSFWYYRVTEPGSTSTKPRLLSARNPLSVLCFKRDVERLANSGIVSMSEMSPSPNHLINANSLGRVSELYLEI